MIDKEREEFETLLDAYANSCYELGAFDTESPDVLDKTLKDLVDIADDKRLAVFQFTAKREAELLARIAELEKDLSMWRVMFG